MPSRRGGTKSGANTTVALLTNVAPPCSSIRSDRSHPPSSSRGAFSEAFARSHASRNFDPVSARSWESNARRSSRGFRSSSVISLNAFLPDEPPEELLHLEAVTSSHSCVAATTALYAFRTLLRRLAEPSRTSAIEMRTMISSAKCVRAFKRAASFSTLSSSPFAARSRISSTVLNCVRGRPPADAYASPATAMQCSDANVVDSNGRRSLPSLASKPDRVRETSTCVVSFRVAKATSSPRSSTARCGCSLAGSMNSPLVGFGEVDGTTAIPPLLLPRLLLCTSVASYSIVHPTTPADLLVLNASRMDRKKSFSGPETEYHGERNRSSLALRFSAAWAPIAHMLT